MRKGESGNCHDPRSLPRGLKPAALGTSDAASGALNGHRSRVFTRGILRFRLNFC